MNRSCAAVLVLLTAFWVLVILALIAVTGAASASRSAAHPADLPIPSGRMTMDGLIAVPSPDVDGLRSRGPKPCDKGMVISAGDRCVVTVLGDWMRADRLIDLHKPLFARLAPLSVGLLRVSVTPIPAPPETSTEDTP